MYCILITGIPASGKSTLASVLSDRLHIPMLSKDSIKELLFDDIGFHSRAEKVALGAAAQNVLYYAARQLLRSGTPFILENNFESSSRDSLLSLLSEFRCTAVTLALTGDLPTIYDRFVQRNQSPSRHRGHVVNDHYPETDPGHFVPPPTFEQFCKGITSRGMTTFTANGPHITLDMTDPSSLDLDALCTQLTPYLS